MSMPLNPYAAYLGESEPAAVLAATPERLRSLLDALGPEGAGRAPAPGKWTVREILCHLADTEVAFAFRLRQTLAEDHHVIQPFDQEKWAAAYGAYEASGALEAFSALRRWNLAWLAAAPAEALSKPVTHPERGTMTFRVLIETMAGHDMNHLRQIEGLAAGNRGGGAGV